MTPGVFLFSLPVGIVLAEFYSRIFGGPWLRRRLNGMLLRLKSFRDAKSDDERQSLMISAGLDTLLFSLCCLAMLGASLALLGLAPWGLRWDRNQTDVYFVAASLVSIGWWLFSRRNAGRAPLAYSAPARLLHWLALQPASVRLLSFELERSFALPAMPGRDAAGGGPADGAVYVCGLARSGTTMLLHLLDQLDVFRSLTYRDMPFVLAPNLWRTLHHRSRKDGALSERSHGDGILIDFDSPEAFEEVFWRTLSPPQRQAKPCYCTAEPSAETLAAFADYRALVANPRTDPGRPRRYLSKNNNNLVRLAHLAADPTASILLVYRDPVATARSLHRQHVRLGSGDGRQFTATYMKWLGHHEFGPAHLPFCFALGGMNPALAPGDINYWLDYWNSVHEHLLHQSSLSRVSLVNHDALRGSPEAGLNAILDRLGIDLDTRNLAAQVRPSPAEARPPEEFHADLLSTAYATHAKLVRSPSNLLFAAR
jgi:hypothetical protein